MTSTEIFSGVQNERPTSRVLKPPGGGSSDIFGGDPAPTHAAGLSSTGPGDSHGNQQKSKNNPIQDSGPSRVGNAIAAKAFAAQNAGTGVASLFGGGYDPPKPAPARMAPAVQQQQEAPPAPAPAPVVAAQPEAPPPSPQQQQQQPEPPVAVAPAQPAAPAPAPAATPAFVRVRQPPGGRSSNIFG